MENYPESRRLVDVAQDMADGQVRILWIGDELAGRIERIRFLDYPHAEYLVAGTWRPAGAFDLITVT